MDSHDSAVQRLLELESEYEVETINFSENLFRMVHELQHRNRQNAKQLLKRLEPYIWLFKSLARLQQNERRFINSYSHEMEAEFEVQMDGYLKTLEQFYRETKWIMAAFWLFEDEDPRSDDATSRAAEMQQRIELQFLCLKLQQTL